MLVEILPFFIPIMVFIFYITGLVFAIREEDSEFEKAFYSLAYTASFFVLTWLLIMPLWLQTFPAEPKPDISVTVLDSWSKVEAGFFSSHENFYIETSEGIFVTQRPYKIGTNLTLYYDNSTKLRASYKVKE